MKCVVRRGPCLAVWAGGRPPAHRAVLQGLLQGGQVACGTPGLGDEALVRGAHAALVEGQVHGLHLADLHLPGRQQPLHAAQHLAQEALRLPQDLWPEQLVRGVVSLRGGSQRSTLAAGTHLLQLLALLLQLLQGCVPGRLLLRKREDVAVEAGREPEGEQVPGVQATCAGVWRTARAQRGVWGTPRAPGGAHQSVILRIFCPICPPQ